MLKLTDEVRLTINYFARNLGKALLFVSIGAVSIYGLGYVVRYFGFEAGTEFIIAMLSLTAYFMLFLLWSNSKNQAVEEMHRQEKIIKRLQDWKE